MARTSHGVSSLIVLVMISSSIHGVPATIYTVGDSSGWSLSGDYGNWASEKAFAVGDTLVFNYSPGHSVDEVSANDYKTCTAGNALTTDSSGATSITLKTAGPHFFICSVSGHCDSGMKLSVNVVAAAAGGTTNSPSSTTGISPPVTGGAGGAFTHPYSSSPTLSPAGFLCFTVCIVTLKSFLR